ncbi:MAG: translation initiation factor IF-2 [Candidatus Zambryskibacteria bacterium CG10_big_fil_rev_8_21_14_0_10_42_12]|uniref:Translation initiation factor IF-2 n=1 Tax=Candidatus Zambryskibacteria bacterium CG10_big_fil_rev_8_21_14_0_10_42_12 TaxID=1975115 RepID=A0A2H0QVE1_9BACT|nr:MAG: translation initiation factor IF-2 [Candidatus Zambryskibacteria bacterium CG10_big_fil_rev_8_21_14_0_10_42_12]
MTTEPAHKSKRPPVVGIFGHIDHGKSTLLDHIRKTNITETEAGGITQHISSYEVEHTDQHGKTERITFLDTPGHEAFSSVRTRGAKAADIAILVVAADDGVKRQTLDALNCIQEAGLTFIVAINKIDKPGANIDNTKQSLAEHNVYVEGYGGNISYAAISAKTGEGISDLLDLVLLTAEMEDLSGDTSIPATGAIIETNLDPKKGISATLIIKNGTLKTGQAIQSGNSFVPVRRIENFLGKTIDEATFSSPVRIVGWSELPQVGSTFTTFDSKKEALVAAESHKAKPHDIRSESTEKMADALQVPIAIKADTAGSIDAVMFEISKWDEERLFPKIVHTGIGTITENDIRLVTGKVPGIVIGFNVAIDQAAKRTAEQYGIITESFDIIYKLAERLDEILNKRIPRSETEVASGKLKILKLFSKTKEKQVIGGRVEEGEILLGGRVNIYRRDNKLGTGVIKELQKAKQKASKAETGDECGLMLESRVEVATGDTLEGFTIEIK